MIMMANFITVVYLLVLTFPVLTICKPSSDHEFQKDKSSLDTIISKVISNLLAKNPDVKTPQIYAELKSRNLTLGSCRSVEFYQTIRSSGCSRKIKNKLCVGNCLTFFMLGISGCPVRYFQWCAGMKKEYKSILLECPGRRDGEKTIQATIEEVKSCACKKYIGTSRDHKNKFAKTNKMW